MSGGRPHRSPRGPRQRVSRPVPVVGAGAQHCLHHRYGAASWAHIGMALLAAAQEVGGVEELDVPERSDDARAVDFE